LKKKKTQLIVNYVLQLAKFDTNYDIREKSRLLRHILFNPNEKTSFLQDHVKELLATVKPAPVIETIESRFRVGTISHIVNHTVQGYTPVFDWCTNPPETSIRDPPDHVPEFENGNDPENDENFYNEENLYPGEGEFFEEGEVEYYYEGEEGEYYYEEGEEGEYYYEGEEGEYYNEEGEGDIGKTQVNQEEIINENGQQNDKIEEIIGEEIKEEDYNSFYETDNNNQEEDHDKNQYLSLDESQKGGNTQPQNNTEVNNGTQDTEVNNGTQEENNNMVENSQEEVDT